MELKFTAEGTVRAETAPNIPRVIEARKIAGYLPGWLAQFATLVRDEQSDTVALRFDMKRGQFLLTVPARPGDGHRLLHYPQRDQGEAQEAPVAPSDRPVQLGVWYRRKPAGVAFEASHLLSSRGLVL
ncbi:hypothetical protein ACIPPN_26635 [Streptomyces diastaticus]|uniref:hypothetical protein n=1 Tax=Streptomyces diastaticus TaxID=1956 RepID=UPI0016740D58|nr:hypothetical protein [Streptomyces diastaticus]GGU45441.1 hypothetical protein GCM10015534_55080 [Streptomyces diastaticus subsp. diastaticus]